MSAYLYPPLKSKAEYRRALKAGRIITAEENTPAGSVPIENGRALFEGPHYPKPHSFAGEIWVKDGKVVKIS